MTNRHAKQIRRVLRLKYKALFAEGADERAVTERRRIYKEAKRRFYGLNWIERTMLGKAELAHAHTPNHANEKEAAR